uniref:Doublesex- and mab-3-related transcription factor C1/C2 C-terminal domain-containing protein n=1 Tax=Rhinolophus ferrumequinum TaxID=59479 RepID=A0A671DPC9_RHIFE
GAAPPKDRNPVKKLGVQAGVFTGKESITPQLKAHPCATPREAPTASGQALVSAASEWQQMLEAAEALLILKQSSQAPSGSISPLQLCVAPAPAGDRGLQPPSPCLPPRLPSSVSQPLGHPACILLLS